MTGLNWVMKLCELRGKVDFAYEYNTDDKEFAALVSSVLDGVDELIHEELDGHCCSEHFVCGGECPVGSLNDGA